MAVGAHEDDAGSVDDQIDAEQRRVLAQEAKLESLKAQEGRAAYEKVQSWCNQWLIRGISFFKLGRKTRRDAILMVSGSSDACCC